jgi:hypothetical protein
VICQGPQTKTTDERLPKQKHSLAIPYDLQCISSDSNSDHSLHFIQLKTMQDTLSETYRLHLKAIETRQRMLKNIPKVKEKLEQQIDQLQKEASIMKIEIDSGKNLS